MELSQYIFPIYSGGTIVGQGFVADGHFITAAHVVKNFSDCFVVLNGKRFDLAKEETAFIGDGDIDYDPLMIDAALFPFDSIDSPLHLSNYAPQKGEALESYCMHEVMDVSSLNPHFNLTMEPAVTNGDEEGNYFFCQCKRFKGSSGSPLLKGNEVVGIMHGGNDNGLCAFLKVDMLQRTFCIDEECLAFCSAESKACEGEDALWYPYCAIIKKNGKIGVVIDSENIRDVIIPIQYDTWFSYDGSEGIGKDFFENYWEYIGYFGIKNSDGTYTCHGYDKEGKLTTSFVCESFNEDVIWLNGKAYIGKTAEGKGYDAVRRMGYSYGRQLFDNGYFAFCKGNKWSLKSDDLKETYIKDVVCNGFEYIGRTTKGFFAIWKRGEKFKLSFGQKNNGTYTLSGEYDYISYRNLMDNLGVHLLGFCFVIKQQGKWAVCSDDLMQLSPFLFDSVGDMVNTNCISVTKEVQNRKYALQYDVRGNKVWNIKDLRTFNIDEISAVKKAEVVPSKYGNSVCFFMQAGGQTYIPLYEQSLLTPGDNVDLSKAIIITLGREDKDNIYRILE